MGCLRSRECRVSRSEIEELNYCGNTKEIQKEGTGDSSFNRDLFFDPVNFPSRTKGREFQVRKGRTTVSYSFVNKV